ncbi:MAG: decaprenyl-phosphate phosphoribosyltransferase [Planctomycetota bacterium]
MKSIYYILFSMRPAQAILKNGFVLAALLFAQKLTDKNALFLSMFAYVLFCILSGCVYLINDVLDKREDEANPEKKDRPVASGKLNKNIALIAALILACLSLLAAFRIDFQFAIVASTYLLIGAIYSIYLKKIVIVDAVVVGVGFILRAVAGAVVINVEISHWLLACTLLLALFLAFTKRRYELSHLKNISIPHRKVLERYSIRLLDQIMAVTTSATLVTYLLYTMESEVITKFNTKYLNLTMPFVLYGIFRYLYLVYKKGEGGRPGKTLLSDMPLLATVFLWTLAVILIIYFLPFR